MKKNIKILGIGLLVAAALVLTPLADSKAQIVPSPISCTALSYNLHIGQYDPTAVTALQVYLASAGYLNHEPTGYFGILTYRAVVNFQSNYSILTSGFVGPITRAKIESLTCGDSNPPVGVSVFSIDPASGPVGTNVTVSGRFFTDANTVFFGGSQIAHVALINQTLSFTVPNSIMPSCPLGGMCPMYVRLVTPGTYPIYISNSNGTSNMISFTVTGGASNSAVSISGVDAPNSLPLGTPGTWTVHVATNGSTNLHYAVAWGDFLAPSASIMAAPEGTIQSSATFTHTYTQAGTYQPSFTVTDDAGHSATTTLSILVTPLY